MQKSNALGRTLYYCDPTKNLLCTKEACMHRSVSWKACGLTTDKRYAQKDADGNPRVYMTAEEQEATPHHLWPKIQLAGNS